MTVPRERFSPLGNCSRVYRALFAFVLRAINSCDVVSCNNHVFVRRDDAISISQRRHNVARAGATSPRPADPLFACEASNFSTTIFIETKNERRKIVWAETHASQSRSRVDVNFRALIGRFTLFFPLCVSQEKFSRLRVTRAESLSRKRSYRYSDWFEIPGKLLRF